MSTFDLSPYFFFAVRSPKFNLIKNFECSQPSLFAVRSSFKFADILIPSKISFCLFQFGRGESWKVEQFPAQFSSSSAHTPQQIFPVFHSSCLAACCLIEGKSKVCSLLNKFITTLWSCSRAFSCSLPNSRPHIRSRWHGSQEKQQREDMKNVCGFASSSLSWWYFLSVRFHSTPFPIPPSRIFVSFRAAKNRNPLGNGW